MIYFNVFAFASINFQFCFLAFLHIFIVAIKKRSRVAGVVVTQNVDQLPPGKSTPDFIRKPMATTVQEGQALN